MRENSVMVDRDSIGEALHVALRKGCDSAATSAAYNCVGLMPNALWGEYLEVVTHYLRVARANENNAWEHLKYASTGECTRTYTRATAPSYDPGRLYAVDREEQIKIIRKMTEAEIAGREWDEIHSDRNRWRYLWHSVLRCFDDDDWRGFASFLYR